MPLTNRGKSRVAAQTILYLRRFAKLLLSPGAPRFILAMSWHPPRFAWFMALAMPGAAAAAADNPFGTDEPYQACVAAVDVKPDDAFEMAHVWRDHGGGVAAERCAAMALIALDEPGEAASRLSALALRTDVGSAAARAVILAQAGNAWLLASQVENAENAFSAALKLLPEDAQLWIDRARARAFRQDWSNAETDLTTALRYQPPRPETFVLRAAARRGQGNANGHKADIDSALSLDPTYPDALVERGTLRMEAGDRAGARADFVQVLLRAPNSPAADTVRTRIEALEIRNP